jgi:hypothetical protein
MTATDEIVAAVEAAIIERRGDCRCGERPCGDYHRGMNEGAIVALEVIHRLTDTSR